MPTTADYRIATRQGLNSQLQLARNAPLLPSYPVPTSGHSGIVSCEMAETIGCLLVYRYPVQELIHIL